MFETVDPRIPSCWIASLSDQGTLRLAPRTWQRPDFWGDYFNREPQTLADFEAGMASVLAESVVE